MALPYADSDSSGTPQSLVGRGAAASSLFSLPPPPAELAYFWQRGRLPEKPLVAQAVQAHRKPEMRFSPSPRHVNGHSSEIVETTMLADSALLDHFQRQREVDQSKDSQPRYVQRKHRASARKLAGAWAETVDAQICAEGDLQEVQLISHLVLENCKALRDRVEEMEEESAEHLERQAMLEDRSCDLSKSNASLEQKCSDLAQANLDLRQELHAAISRRKTEPQRFAAKTAAPALEEAAGRSATHDRIAALERSLVDVHNNVLTMASRHHLDGLVQGGLTQPDENWDRSQETDTPPDLREAAFVQTSAPRGPRMASWGSHAQPGSEDALQPSMPSSSAANMQRLNGHLEYLRLRVAESKLAAHAAGMAAQARVVQSPKAMEERPRALEKYEPHVVDNINEQYNSWGIVGVEQPEAESTPQESRFAPAAVNSDGLYASPIIGGHISSIAPAFQGQSDVTDAASDRLRVLEEELRAEFHELKTGALRKRAVALGIDEGRLEAADDAEDTKAALIDLIVGGSVLSNATDTTAGFAGGPHVATRTQKPPSRSVAAVLDPLAMGNGQADVLYTGADRNNHGIPDALQAKHRGRVATTRRRPVITGARTAADGISWRTPVADSEVAIDAEIVAHRPRFATEASTADMRSVTEAEADMRSAMDAFAAEALGSRHRPATAAISRGDSDAARNRLKELEDELRAQACIARSASAAQQEATDKVCELEKMLQGQQHFDAHPEYM